MQLSSKATLNLHYFYNYYSKLTTNKLSVLEVVIVSEILNSHFDEDYDVKFKGWDRIYDETFLGYLALLIKRSDRLNEFDINSLDYSTYADICLVMIRAMLIENVKLKANYTVQNYLTKHNRNDLVKEADDFVNQQINSLMTLREALKIAVDKFIAHNDTITITINDEIEIDSDSWFKRNLFISDIKRTEGYPFKIQHIVIFIKALVEQVLLQDE